MHWQPGLIALHGNQTDLLAEAVAEWLRAHPLAPLEPEAMLVQSNGMAEWLKMQLARQHGVCAAARMELPARFLWRTCRQVLGRRAVPQASALDKVPLTWRLMRLLPQLLDTPGFAPVARFVRADDQPQRLLQLCQRLADLYDQYQVYRGDWLDDWAAGRAVLRQPGGQAAQELPSGQRWQALLWQALLADLPEPERAASRTAVLQRTLARLESGEPPERPVARRVVVFGLSHMPLALLRLLAALARHSQVLLAVPNPCRYHWADAIDGRELLRLARRRHPLRAGRDLGALPLSAMHAHAHPLLAAWGRQCRDHVRQLDEFDTSAQMAERMAWPRIDLFDDSPAHEGPLLAQVQRSIRDLLPLAEHPRAQPGGARIPAADRSVVFHSAHSLLRELEVLHDQLLDLLAAPPPAGQAPLQPRDVVVMLPDVQAAAPAIRAVFGQYAAGDARHLPFDIADLGARASSPLLGALQWLLQLPRQRCRLSELGDLLQVPAVAARFGLQEGDAPQLLQWMASCGIRWGLDGRQRGALGLHACGEHNSAWFGLRRMLLGYASGSHGLQAGAAPAFQDIEPYGEVGGLDAELAGVLAGVLERLLRWWQDALLPATPEAWAGRLRALVQDLFAARDEADRAVLAALEEALQAWLQACEQAGYAEEVPLAVAQSAWLAALEQPALHQRFRAGGVTFCTLMPMRAIPFEVVCLLGMNDGDYPRRAPRSPFDLMQLPGHYRPGDRARRDDDRQLMLEALLSARRVLYVSWSGRNVRDNSAQPPSVLVAQLRDYLAAGWQGESESGGEGTLLAERTCQHPLQPFSRAYFEAGSGLSTHAAEWRQVHAQRQALQDAQAGAAPLPTFVPDPRVPLSLDALTRFVRHPARSFFRQRLAVQFEVEDAAPEDDEVFGLDGLQHYQLVQELQEQVSSAWWSEHQRSGSAPPIAMLLQAQVARLQRAGRLPLAGLGRHAAAQLQETLAPCLAAWQQLRLRHSRSAARRPLHFRAGDVVLQDWLDALLLPEEPGAVPLWLQFHPGPVTDDKGRPHADKLLPLYLRSLAAAACDVPLRGLLLGRDGCLRVQALGQDEARAALQALLQVWREGQDTPLPLPRATALALLEGAAIQAQAAYEGSYQRTGEVEDPYWARLYPDFEALQACGRLQQHAPAVFGPLRDWGEQCLTPLAWDEALREEVAA
ncbi:exodeoxyribonuclease V subunit gamma [Melaminivora sp.]|uniref:exodeoxyribonuclease V subunit gamma n=1 Tax=Melaminivora sp. TaxID=1933032 RepID=UPI0028A834E8|nr:exodeoxyribonuclease V subunit gamma [Melaminivora sp.]